MVHEKRIRVPPSRRMHEVTDMGIWRRAVTDELLFLKLLRDGVKNQSRQLQRRAHPGTRHYAAAAASLAGPLALHPGNRRLRRARSLVPAALWRRAARGGHAAGTRALALTAAAQHLAQDVRAALGLVHSGDLVRQALQAARVLSLRRLARDGGVKLRGEGSEDSRVDRGGVGGDERSGRG